MKLRYHVGDVVILPPTCALGYSTFDGFVALVTEVKDNTVVICTNDSKVSEVNPDTLSLLKSYDALIEAFTQKGAELVDRAEKG